MTRDDWPAFDDEIDRPIRRTIRSFAWRISVSILAPTVWLSFVLLFLAFWAHALTFPQEIVVGVVSVLALLATMVVTWVSFGVRMVRHWVDW